MGSIDAIPRIPRNAPVDSIAPEHEWVDDQLSHWGRWTRARAGMRRCGSIEGEYRSPWRQWHYPSYEELMPRLDDAEIALIDRAVLRVDFAHQLALKLHYAWMVSPYHTCRRVKIPTSMFGAWMHDARAMVLTNLRNASHERAADRT